MHNKVELKQIFPFLTWHEVLTKKKLFADSIAGLVVALILIPQSIAYAQLAGLPPQQGLYAAFIAPIIASLFGSSTKLSTGPVAIVSLVTASALATLNVSDPVQMVKYVIILAVLVGVVQLIFGIFRLGIIVNFISHPVMMGFSNAAALIIATSQLPKIFGVKVGNYDHHYETMYHFVIGLFSSFHLLSMLFAIAAIIIIIWVKKIHPLTPGVLIVMVLSTLISWIIGFEKIGGSVVGNIPPGIPQLSLLTIDSNAIPTLFSTAVVIAILGFMESYSIGKSLALTCGEKINANREFIGQGLANICSAAVQGYPVAGSFSRSAVNFKAGAQTGMSGVFTGFYVLITLLLFTPLLYHLPQSVLSAIIITSVINLVNLEKIKETYKVVRIDGIIAGITFIATLFFAPHLDKGIVIGVVLSTAYYIYTRTKPHVVQFTLNRAGKFIEVDTTHKKTCAYISVIRFDGSLFFANATYLENQIMNVLATKNKTKYIIIDAQSINFIDSSGVETLINIQKELHESGKEILFVRIKEDILEVIKKTELYKKIHHKIYDSRTSAIRAIYTHTHHDETEEKCPLLQLIS
jgi:SulP family sulfate permease